MNTITRNTPTPTIDVLTDAHKRALCRLYAKYVKPSWINLLVQLNTHVITRDQLDIRLQLVYDEFYNSEYGFHWLRFNNNNSNIRLMMDPLLATKELTPDSLLLCGDTRIVNGMMVNLSYADLTEMAATSYRVLLEYVLLQAFKHAPGDEIFGVCDGFKIELPYRYNIENPEMKTVTIIPLRSPGRQHERKVHRHVLADVSERFKTTLYGSGQMKAKNNIQIDCDHRLLDWFIDGIYKGELNLSLIRTKQRKYAYKMLNETMVCTSQDLGEKVAFALGIKSLNEIPAAPSRNYYDSDSDSD